MSTTLTSYPRDTKFTTLRLGGKSLVINSITITLEERDTSGNVLRCYGTSVPTDASAGYAPGCIFRKTNGTVATTFYINEGSSSSSDFNAMETAASTVTSVTAGNGLTGGGTEGAVTLNVANTDGNITVSADSIDLASSPNIAANLTWTKEVNHTNSVSDSTSSNTAGGNLTYAAGKGTGTAAGGTMTITSGASSNGTAVSPGASGAVVIASGTPGTATTGTAGAAGSVTIGGTAGGNSTGASSTAGAGSDVSITAGAGGNSSGGGDTGGRGGNIILTAGAAGTGATAGIAGMIFQRSRRAVKKSVTSMTTSATITTDAIIGGIITANQGGGAAATYTTPTGAVLAAALPVAFTTGDSLDFCIVNISTNASEDVTVAAGASGITLAGNMVVASNAAASDWSVGQFTILCTGAATYTIYRVA